MAVRVAELETLFTGKIDQSLERSTRAVEASNRDLDGKVIEQSVVADISRAQSAMADIEAEGRRLAGQGVDVPVDADTSAAEDAIDGLPDKAKGAGDEGGDLAGAALAGGIVGALTTIPIAGAVVGIAEAAAQAVIQGFEDGLAVEARADLLAGRTGLDEATAGRLGAAAGEAYANRWGTSIEANMDTARSAIEAGLLDPQATQRDAQQIIESVTGVADIIQEDAARVARSSSQLIRTGIARDAQEAFDIIVRGQQAGLNASEDWLDTLDEYSVQWQKLGLEGGDVLGLLQQGVQAGARDTDIVADSLKELAIRAIDGSRTTVEGFEAIGLSAEDMGDKFAAGGESAREALGQTLDGLRSIEDPVQRDAAAVALFGTQAEDLGAALAALDLDTAASGFSNLDGAAQRALDTIGDNAKGSLDSAVRNIEVAGDSIKGSLAQAFNPQIEGFATFVSENREAVTTFLFDAAEGAIDFGIALVDGTATGTEAIGDFLGGPVAQLIDATASLAEGFDRALPGDQESEEFRTWADDTIAGLSEADDSLAELAETTRTNLIDNALTPAQEKLGELRIPAEAAARLSDTTRRLAETIGEVGYEADGSKASIELLDGGFDTSTKSGRLLDRQVRNVAESLRDQVGAAAASGESQDSLRDRVRNARQAFLDQAEALGINQSDAKKLAEAYGLIPDKVVTTVIADTSAARSAVETFIQDASGRTVAINVGGRHGVTAKADGGLLEFFADGTENHVAQIAPAGTWRVWAEPETGGEAYIPLAPAKRDRSMDILEDVAHRFGARVVPQADGSVLTAPTVAASAPAAVTAVLAPEDRALLRAVAARPVSVQLDERELASSLRQVTTRWSTR